MNDCEHTHLTTYFLAGGEPAGLWACAECRHKFVPIDLGVEHDAERYRWIVNACEVTYMGREIESTGDIDAAMNGANA